MIRNEAQRRRALVDREKLATGGLRESGEENTEYGGGRRLEELDGELAEYEALRSGEVRTLSSEGVESIGELLIKARLARGLTLAELGELLSMTEQQVGRYEQESWRRASLWRLGEAAEVLGLGVTTEVRL